VRDDSSQRPMTTSVQLCAILADTLENMRQSAYDEGYFDGLGSSRSTARRISSPRRTASE